MFPDFIEQAGVEAKTDSIWGGGFTPGYDILTTVYSSEEFTKILNFSKKVFAEKGLGTPLSFRAGAWFANLDILTALDDTGFLVDTSGRTKYSFGTNNIPGYWDLSSTTQPYHPSSSNQNSNKPLPHFKILEIPNNGADSYAFSASEMIKRFNDNYQGGVLNKPKQVTYLSHPHWFKPSRQQAMDQVFSHINSFSNKQDLGPVIYTTLLGVHQAWETE